MIPTIEVPFDTTQRMLGILTKKIIGLPLPSEKLKLNIPILMPKIAKGDPKISVAVTGCNSLFINDNACKPKVKSTIKHQNYISVALSLNNRWENVCHKTGNVVRYLKKGDKFECQTKSGKLNKLLFNTKGYTI
jgi:hypothetical protein